MKALIQGASVGGVVADSGCEGLAWEDYAELIRLVDSTPGSRAQGVLNDIFRNTDFQIARLQATTASREHDSNAPTAAARGVDRASCGDERRDGSEVSVAVMVAVHAEIEVDASPSPERPDVDRGDHGDHGSGGDCGGGDGGGSGGSCR